MGRTLNWVLPRLAASSIAVSLLGVWPSAAGAVTQEDFLARTTRQVVALCDAPSADPMRVAAIHFCEGFIVGAYRYHEAEQLGPRGSRLFCLPTAGVTRDQVVQMFVQWADKNPQYMNERPVDSLVRFAVATWPCGK